jgi:hypothetical protein
MPAAILENDESRLCVVWRIGFPFPSLNARLEAESCNGQRRFCFVGKARSGDAFAGWPQVTATLWRIRRSNGDIWVRSQRIEGGFHFEFLNEGATADRRRGQRFKRAYPSPARGHGRLVIRDRMILAIRDDSLGHSSDILASAYRPGPILNVTR